MILEEMKEAMPGETVWDKGERASIKGLHLRAMTNGTRVFLLYYRTRAGAQRKPKIGELGEITLAEARRRSKLLLDRVAVGEDPKGLWDEQKAELTAQELFEKTWKGHWSQERYKTSGWAREVKFLFDKHLKKPFGPLKLSEMNSARIRDWHDGYRMQSPYAGNRALSVLGRMFQFAEEKEWRPQHTNPCRLVKSHPEKKRKRYATEEEIKRLAPLLEREAEKYPAAVAFLYLLIFSGSRPRAIERATWDQLKEIDVDGQPFGILSFSGKTSEDSGEEERVILPPQAMRVIAKLPRVEGYTITGLQMPRKLWVKLKTEAGCSDLWARDWRRTFATIGMTGGIEMGTIGQLLNHRSNETTKIYAKVMEQKQIQVASTIATKLETLMQEKAK